PGRACLARPARQARRRQQGLTFELDGPRRSADNQPRWREVVVRPDILVQQAQGSSTLRSGRLRAAGRLLTLVLAAGAVACGSDDNGSGDGGGGERGGGGDGGGGGEGGGGIDQPPMAEDLATLAGTGTSSYVDGSRNHALSENPVNVLLAPDGDV